MIVIKVELWPRGNAARKKVLGTAKIANDGTGTETRGRYVFELRGRLERVLASGRVHHFPRKRLNAWDLLYACLKQSIGHRWNEEDGIERCEGGLPECGRVVAHDSEGVPLCARCYRELRAEAEKRAAGGAK